MKKLATIGMVVLLGATVAVTTTRMRPRHAMIGAIITRTHQMELAVAWLALQEVARLHALDTARIQSNDQSRTDPAVTDSPTFFDWQRQPVAERWARYASPAWARVRLITRVELALLGVGVLALLLRTLGRGAWFLIMFATMRRRLQLSVSHGSAHWAGGTELRAMHPQKGRADLIIGRVGRQLVSIREEIQYEHLLLVAPTGAGKTSSVILPNLLAEPGIRSLVITDPKRELLRKSALSLVHRYGSGNVWVLDFLDPALSRGYNPLAYVTDAATADLFAQTWVRNTGESKDAFWSNAARTLIAAAALHLIATEEIVPPLVALVDLLCSTPADVVSATLAASPVPEVRRLAHGFLANMAKNERLLGSVFTELPPRFSCLNIAAVRATTGVNEIDFARLATVPTALYLALDPQYGRTLAPLTACFFLHFFTTLTAMAKAAPSGALPVPVMAYLDEFGTIGHIPEFAGRMATVRSARIGCLLVVQDQAQLTKAYGEEDADTILSNATTKMCLARVTRDDAEYFSDLAGKTTVHSANQSASRPLLLPWADRGNRGVGEVQRALITPDELRTMRDEIFVIVGEHNPIRARQRRYYDVPSLARLVPNASDPDPLQVLQRPVALPVPDGDPLSTIDATEEWPDRRTVGMPTSTPIVPVVTTPAENPDPSGVSAAGAPPTPPQSVLTPSQRRLLDVLATMPTASSTQLAAALGVQRSTVRDSLMKIRRALGIGQAEDIVMVAQERRLLPDHDGTPTNRDANPPEEVVTNEGD